MKWGLLLIGILFLSCTPPKYSVIKRPQTFFVKGSTITVVPKKDDPLNIQGDIEHILFSKGFNVVTREVARKSIEINADGNISKDQASGKASIYSTEYIKSVYVLSFMYRYKNITATTYGFNSFSGSIFDLNSGKLITSLKFEQGEMFGLSTTDTLEQMFREL